jgi:flagellar basal body-associated protein FliL
MKSEEVDPPVGDGDENQGGNDVVEEEKTPASVVLAIVFGIGFGVCLAAAATLAFFYFKKNGKPAKAEAEENTSEVTAPAVENVEEKTAEETKENEDATEQTSESDE